VWCGGDIIYGFWKGEEKIFQLLMMNKAAVNFLTPRLK
tara:strand:+ start:456 stop:569 length:114 start_codon:yes stop_codon:yes gene_type:complete